MRNKTWLIVEKIGTLLGDRRFWAYLISIGIVLGAIPATIDAEKLSNTWVEGILLLVQGATALFGVLVLIYSWTKRPPSGLNYKEIPTEVEKLLPVLKELFSQKEK